MTLPEPSSERSRQLLQVIWNLSGSREANWPTFAAIAVELDRQPALRGATPSRDRLQRLLAQMPVGLVNGVSPGTTLMPDDRQELSLTVAGVAACKGTEGILELLLQFIGYAVKEGRETDSRAVYSLPWPISSGTVSVTFMGFLARYLLSRGRLPSRSGGKKEMLKRLYLILATEPAWWTRLSHYDRRDWIVEFGRAIRYFKFARTLEDYWSCRFKPWETSDSISYPVVTTGSPEEANRPRLLCDHSDILADVLLGRIFDISDGQTSVAIPCPRVDPDVDLTVTQNALSRLESQGLIWYARADSTRQFSAVMLTGAGFAHISALRRDWADDTFRMRAARDALLAWLYDRAAKVLVSVPIAEFFGDTRSAYGGQFFARYDLDAAASYLQEKNLIIRSGKDPVKVKILADGIDCMERGGSVAEHVERPAQATASYSFNAPVGNVAIGKNAHQYAAINAMDADSLRTLMKAIIEALPGLDLDIQGRKDAEDATNQVVYEVQQHEPDRPRLRAAMQKIRELLALAGNQALAAVLSAAVDYERVKLGIPPAS
jgi:hypothetical protein